MKPDPKSILTIVRQFISPFSEPEISPLGRGNINDSYLVATASGRFVLQRINTAVFPNPLQLMDNFKQLCHHLQKKKESSGYCLAPLVLFPTLNGDTFFQDRDGSIWRGLHYIAPSTTCFHIESQQQATEIGQALAHFHLAVSDLPPDKFFDPLPGFHILPQYLAQFEQVNKTAKQANTAEVRYCLSTINKYKIKAGLFEKGKQTGQFKEVIVHGDPKIENFLFDRRGEKVLAIIDLDTAGPGLIHFDIGDCLRSACNRTGEELKSKKVQFDTDICRAILHSYLRETDQFLRPVDKEHIFDAIQLMCFELGLRFFSDYLQNNIYFKTDYPEQNLERAVTQFRLLDAVSAREKAIRKMMSG